MSKNDKVPATKPFPWKCKHCGERTVRPATVRYAVDIDHDGRVYTVIVPDLETPRCERCGEIFLDSAANKRITQEFRRQAKLLTPEEIRRCREALSLTQWKLASILGIAEATLSRWETGAQVQQRLLDKFMRIVFGLSEVRALLADDQRLAALGVDTGVSYSIQTAVTLRALAGVNWHGTSNQACPIEGVLTKPPVQNIDWQLGVSTAGVSRSGDLVPLEGC